jgi:hypothetical protein
MDPGHTCPWKEEVALLRQQLLQKEAALCALQQKLEAVLAQMAALERRTRPRKGVVPLGGGGQAAAAREAGEGGVQLCGSSWSS